MGNVFISYSRLDDSICNDLYKALRAAEFKVFRDQNIPGGSNWWEHIRKEIRSASCVLVLASANSGGSPFCQLEIEYALGCKKRIFVVFLDDWGKEGTTWKAEREEAICSIAKKIGDKDQTTLPKIWKKRLPHLILDNNISKLRRLEWISLGGGLQPLIGDLKKGIEADVQRQKSRQRNIKIAAVTLMLVGIFFALWLFNSIRVQETQRDAGAVVSYVDTLSASGINIPVETLTPQALMPTLTARASLLQWQPKIVSSYQLNGIAYDVEMVEVPPGCFYMGRSAAAAEEQPSHEQCFDEAFYIDRYEVTQAQFLASWDRRTNGERDFEFEGNRNRPVEIISWFEARDFCEQRGARLPTEREWEYAARGPNSLIYPWGNEFDEEIVIYRRTTNIGTAPVMNEQGQSVRSNASWVGALDMSGNVSEWTSTIYDIAVESGSEFSFQSPFLYPYPYPASDGRERDESIEEYQNNQSDYTFRVVRGGSWYDQDSAPLSGASRRSFQAGAGNSQVGFRCVRDNLS